MIVYDLKCENGHKFEGWFEDADAFETQQARSMITCPVCNVASVVKIPSTFAIKTASANQKEVKKQQISPERLMKKIHDFVESNFDDVGCDFAKEALKIHYGAAEPRNIKGVSTSEEEKTLKEEGIDFIKIPMPPQSDTDA